MRIKFNKKFMSLCLAGFLSICPIALKRANAETKNYIMANTNVKIRSESNTDSDKLGLLKTGKSLEVIRYLDNGWYEVIYEGKTAYVCGDYVSFYSINDEVKESDSKQDVVIANTVVNVRKSNSTDSDIIGSIGDGDALDYFEKTDNGWYKVSYLGQTGYVYGDYVDLGSKDLDIQTVPVVVANTGVNLREYSTAKSEKVGFLNPGDSLEVVNLEDNGWYKVIYNDGYAYVCGDYVTLSNKEIIKNKIYKNIALLDDKILYSDPELKNPICTVPRNELFGVYNGYGNRYLVKSDYEYGTGYISKAKTCNMGRDPFVVVDISDQEAALYKDDFKNFRADTVTGGPLLPTDEGLWSIKSMKTNYYLAKYDVTVDFWMEFHDGQGIHNNRKRKKFGGNIYKYDGSHGCVNLSYNAAKKFYDNVHVGTKVLVKR